MRGVYSSLAGCIQSRGAPDIGGRGLGRQSNPTVIQVTIKQSKTDPFRQGVNLHLGKTGKNTCPVGAIIPYLAIRRTKPGPLFVFDDGAYLTRQRFASMVTSTLQRAGIEDKRFKTHSFRIEAATTAKEAGCTHNNVGKVEE